MRITLLGCGGSLGVPIVGDSGGFWGRCNPENPKNRRMRSCVHAQDGATSVLLDTSPDLRMQLLTNDIIDVDAILYTHAHADHVDGVNDLRRIAMKQGASIDVYADDETITALKKRFGYLFDPDPKTGHIYKPWLEAHQIQCGHAFKVGNLTVEAFHQTHGPVSSLGFLLNEKVAYSTDVTELTYEVLERLKGIKLWVVDCFQEAPHHTHAWLERALEWIDIVKPDRAILTHMGADLDYDWLCKRLPKGVEPGVDGLVVEV